MQTSFCVIIILCNTYENNLFLFSEKGCQTWLSTLNIQTVQMIILLMRIENQWICVGVMLFFPVQAWELFFHCDLGGMQLILHWSDLHLAKARLCVIFVLCCVLICALNSFLINILLKTLLLRQDQFSFGCELAPVWAKIVWQRPSGASWLTWGLKGN